MKDRERQRFYEFAIVNVESDGPIPAEFSMVTFGAVLFNNALDKTFYGKTRPVSERFISEALVVNEAL